MAIQLKGQLPGKSGGDWWHSWPFRLNAVWIAVTQVGLWASFLELPSAGHRTLPLSNRVLLFANAAFFGIALIVALTKGSRTRWKLTALALAASYLLNAYAALYWRYGTPPDFNQRLTALDALYFALGTLTTSGTSPINATSQLGRGIVTTQMLADLVLIAGLVPVTLSSLLSLRGTGGE